MSTFGGAAGPVSAQCRMLPQVVFTLAAHCAVRGSSQWDHSMRLLPTHPSFPFSLHRGQAFITVQKLVFVSSLSFTGITLNSSPAI